MDSYDDLLEAGYRLADRDQHVDALESFRRAAELRPKEKEPLVQLALLFQQLGDADGAIGLLHKAAGLSPDNAYVLLNLGLVHYEEERWGEAEHYLRAAVEVIERGTAATRRQVADQVAEESEEILNQCDQLDQTAAEARELIAEIENRNFVPHPSSITLDGSPNGVDTAASRHGSRQSGRSRPVEIAEKETLLRLGDELQQQENFQQAADQYRRVLSIEPSHFSAHLKLGRCLSIEGRRDEALEHVLKGEASLEETLSHVTSAFRAGELEGEADARLNPVINDLKSLLRQAKGMRDGILLREMFSEASTRKITPEEVEQLLPAVRSGKRMRIGVLITLWKRHGLADLVLLRCKSIKEELAPLLDLEIMVVGSEGETSRALAAARGFEYLECENSPLGAKYNAGLRALKDRDVDAVALVGSDDFVDDGLFRAYAAGLNAGYALLGILDMYLFDLESLRTCYWPGYGRRGGRQGESLGLGRCISRRLLDRVNWTLWHDSLDRGLDSSMIERLAPHLAASPQSFKIGSLSIRDHGITAIDVKSDINLWGFDQMVSGLQGVRYMQPISFLDDHFDSCEAGRLLALSAGANRISELLNQADYIQASSLCD